MTCETKFENEKKSSNISGISLLKIGEGFIAVKNDNGIITPNTTGIIIPEKKNEQLCPSNCSCNTNNTIEYDENTEFTMLRIFYLGGISFTGLYLFYRIMSK